MNTILVIYRVMVIKTNVKLFLNLNLNHSMQKGINIGLIIITLNKQTVCITSTIIVQCEWI